MRDSTAIGRGTAALLLAALLGLIGPSARAEVRLPQVFGDHMVIQRDRPVTVWGWADAGETITVELGGQTGSTQASDEGTWMVRLPALQPGGPLTLIVSGENSVTLEDILVGEVWLCSGQSNMEWPVRETANADAALEQADHPRIRFFDIPHAAATTPQKEVDAQWEVCNRESLSGFSGVGYYFGRELQTKLDVPIGLISSNWGGTRIEPWTPPEGFESVSALDRLAIQVAAQQKAPQNLEADRRIPTHLYNGMVHPLVPFELKGAIWYQGESNLRDGSIYRAKMEALIRGWRDVWDRPEMPFYYVQLAPYDYGDADPRLLPEIWQAQLDTLKLPHTGMAVITDLGDLEDIHPRNKTDVGLRLASWALTQTYGRERSYSGPLYESMTLEEGQIRIHFAHAEDGLETRDGEQPTDFEIAGADRRFVSAKARIDGSAVLVWSEEVPHPVAVRFAWHERAQPNLVNKAGLPASPFRTDQ